MRRIILPWGIIDWVPFFFELIIFLLLPLNQRYEMDPGNRRDVIAEQNSESVYVVKVLNLVK